MTPPMDRDELIARLRYILDADGKEYVARTSHLRPHDLRQCLAALESRPPTIWEDPAGKGYPCFERPMTPQEARETIERLSARVVELESRPAPTEERMQAYERVTEYIAYLLSALQPFANAAETADDRNAINDPKGEARAMPWNFVNSTHFAEAFGAYTERLDPDDLEILRPVATDTTPSRDEEGSVDREAIYSALGGYQSIFNAISDAVTPVKNHPDDKPVTAISVEAFVQSILPRAALKTSTPETQPVEQIAESANCSVPVEGGGQ